MTHLRWVGVMGWLLAPALALATDPPVGTEVPYLPEGYKTETIGGVEYMKLGPTYYRPYFKGDEVSYVVSKP